MIVALLALLAASPAATDRPKLVVLDLSGSTGVEAGVTEAMTQAVTAEISRRGYFEAVSSRDLAALIGVERQKQLLGCSESSSSCVAELAGALGARFVLSGQVARLGDTWQLALQTIDSEKAQPIGRSTRLARSLDELRAGLPFAVADATATPPPTAPSRVLPITLISAGAAAVIAGGVVGYLTLQREATVNRELELGQMAPQVLRPLSAYEDDVAQTATQRTVSLCLLGAGAALAVTGVVLLLVNDRPSSTTVAFAPGFGSLNIVGTFF